MFYVSLIQYYPRSWGSGGGDRVPMKNKTPICATHFLGSIKAKLAQMRNFCIFK